MAVVGALVAKLSLNSMAFTKGMRSAGRTTHTFGRGMQGAGRMVRGFAGTLTAAVGPLVGFAGLLRGLRVAETFQQEMNSSLAIVRNVTPQMRKEMENLTKSLAYELKYSASELAKGYYYLFSAGLDVEKTMQALPVTARFAQAGMTDLAQATEILMDTMSALSLDRDPETYLHNLAGAADMIAMAATQANATITQFGEALTNKAAARMKVLKIPLAEGLALLQAFASQAKKGADGGTAFDIVLRDLTKAAAANADVFARLGIQVFDAYGNLRPLPDIIASVEGAFAGLSAQAATMQLTEMGIPAKSSAFLAMVLGMSDKMREWAAANREAGGTLQEIADKQLPAFTKAWNKIKAIGEAFAIDTLTPWLTGLGEALELLTDADKHYRLLDTSAKTVAKSTSGIVSQLDGLEVVIGAIADAWYHITLGMQMAKVVGLDLLTIFADMGLLVSSKGEDMSAKMREMADEVYLAGVRMAEDFLPSEKMQMEKIERQMERLRKLQESQEKLDLGAVGGAIEIAPPDLTEQMKTFRSLITASVTPAEKLRNTMADITSLLEAGAISQREFARAAGEAQKQYQQATVPAKLQAPMLARTGGREAYELMVRSQGQQRQENAMVTEMKGVNKRLDRQTEIQREGNEMLDRIEDLLSPETEFSP